MLTPQPRRLIYGNPLAFPAGRKPGFDPTHPAAAGLTVGNGVSGIASGANFVSLLSGKRYTVTNTVTATISQVGPSASFAASALVAGEAQSVAPSALTFGAICYIASHNANYPTLISLGGGHNGLSLPNETPRIYATTTSVLAPFTLTFPGAWFVAVSCTASNANWVATNLTTGTILSGTSSYSGTLGWVATSPSVGGDGSFGFTNGSIAAVMMSGNLLSIPRLLAWAADPWSFWYPPSYIPNWVGSAVSTTQLRTTQIGAEPWFSDPANAVSSQIGAEAWWRIGTVFQSSQIGVEVWIPVTAPPAKGGFNMPMLGM